VDASDPHCHNPRLFSRFVFVSSVLTIGIGLGLARFILRNDPQLTVIATGRSAKETQSAILAEQDEEVSKRLRVLEVDVTDEDSIRMARKQVEEEFGAGGIKCLFNVSGIVRVPFISLTSKLFPEKTVMKVSYSEALEMFKVNTLGPLFMMKHFLPLVPRKLVPATKLFPQDFSLITSMSARLGSIADNDIGGWYSYRSSKAAQNQITKTLHLELGRKYNAVAIGYHPGTVKTSLSGKMGSKRLEAGLEGVFTVGEAVDKMIGVMGEVKRYHSGTVIDWRGNRIPW
jgi:NAD(P)-dependent dehydrogenase (short-subunit alcohol dehydrogenase family)